MYKNPGGLIHEAETSREGVISSSTDPSSNILVHVLDTQVEIFLALQIHLVIF